MAYTSLGAYSGTLMIPEFKGLNQYGDGVGTDPRYAAEAVNALTTDGYLRPMAPCELLNPTLPEPIETLALLHRRYYAEPDAKDVLIACCSGQFYWCLPSYYKWEKIPIAPTYLGDEYKSSHWSWVAYEINPEGSEAPVDVLILSNELDGMICIRGDTLTAEVIPTPKKFGVIERHAERIWGGAITDDPDMLVYCTPYDPFNWEQNDEYPEDGAGDILQPSWDGDSFTRLATFGGYLIAFKRNRVWRVLGTNPGEYIFKEQYGGGVNYARTVAVSGTRILMLGRDGLLQYNGESVFAYYQEYAHDVWQRMNREALDNACACMWRDKYYLALPLDGSKTNNAVLIFDTTNRTFLLRDDLAVESFLPAEEALYFTSSTTPGRMWVWHEDSEETGSALPMRWVTNWQDFGRKDVAKGSFTVYATVECKEPVELQIGIQTEKKTKIKVLAFAPPANGQQAKQRRLVFGGNGRRFRVIIESNGTVPWKMIGGVQVEAETDMD